MNHLIWALSLSYIISINGGMSEEKSDSSSSDLKDISQANNTFYRPNNLYHERFVRNITEDKKQVRSDNNKILYKKDIDCIVTDLLRKTLEETIKGSNNGNESVLTGRIFHKTLQKLKRPLTKDDCGFVMDSRVKSIPLYSGPMLAENEKSQPIYYDHNLCSALVQNPDESDLPYKHTNINIVSNEMKGNDDVQEEGDNEDINKTKLSNSKTDLMKLIIAVYPFQVGFLDGSLIRNLYRRRNTMGPFEKRRATKISQKDKYLISAQSNLLNNDIKDKLDEQENIKKIISIDTPKMYSFTTSRIESHKASKVYSKLASPNQKYLKDDLNDFQNLLYPFLHHNNVQASEYKRRDDNSDHMKNKNHTLSLEHKFKNVSLVERDQLSNTSNCQEEPFMKIRAKNGPITLTLRYGSKQNINMATPSNSVPPSNYGNNSSFNTTFSLFTNNSVALRDAFFELSKPFNFSCNKALKCSAVSNSKKTSKSFKDGILDFLNISSPQSINMNKDLNSSSDLLNKSTVQQVIIEPGNENRNKGKSIENKEKFIMENEAPSFKTKFKLLENPSNDPSIKVLSLFSNIPDPHELDHKINDHVERKNSRPLVSKCFQIVQLNAKDKHINNSVPFSKAISSINETSLNNIINNWINTRQLSNISDPYLVDPKKYINLDQSNHELINRNSSLLNNIKTYKEFPADMQIIEVSNKSLTNRQIKPIKSYKQVMSGQG